jgi:lactoylglutathione lyase
MFIEHVAIWTNDLDVLRDFYIQYFGAQSGKKHTDARFDFESYSLLFPSGPRLELMLMPSIPKTRNNALDQFTGFIHIAFEVATENEVRKLSSRLEQDGHRVVDLPHSTSDGYFECAVLDPDGNRIEIMATKSH